MHKIQTIALVVGIGFGTSAVAADPMELKTSDRAVLGAAEVAAGDYVGGISKSERALRHANHNLVKAPALINLCVAHAATGSLDRADEYCSAAVETGVDTALAYNNRAVVHYLRGDIESCIADLERAAELQAGSRVIKRNLTRARSKQAMTVASAISA